MTTRRSFLKGTAIAGAALAASRAEAFAADTQPNPELEEITIADLQKQQQTGAQSSEQITQAYLARIEAIDRNGPKLNSVIELNPDALAIARQLDAERKAGKLRSPMHGIPVLIKDNISTADRMQTTAGSLALLGAGAPGGKDSFVAAQLRQAGAVILGKTNLSEWANLRSTHSTSGWSARGGLTHCPYALDRNPSGSSSGSGAATSANLCAVAVGTETDGSIVSPSCSNGLVGIKPTVGLVSRAGIVPISHTQDTAGPMARSVADAATLLSALAGVDSNDPATAAAQGHIAPDYTKFLDADGLRGMRVGVVRKFAGFNRDADKLFDESIEAMRKLGAVIVDPVDIPTNGKWGDPELTVLLYEFKADLNKYLASLGAKSQVKSLADLIKFNEANAAKEMPYFGQELLIQAQEKGTLDSDEYKKALADCKRLTQAEGIDAALAKDKLDLLIGITGAPAWMTDLVDGDNSGVYSDSSLPAVAGYPHVTVPMGMLFGLPLNISFIGTAWSERKLIKAAYAYEQATKHRQPPKFLATANLSPKSS
jgi:amidase